MRFERIWQQQLSRVWLFLLCLLLASVATPETAAAGPEEAYLKTAEIIYQSTPHTEGEDRLKSLQRVRDILDKIVTDFPASDLAVQILLKETVNGIDISALDTELQAAPVETAPEPAPQPTELPSTAASEPVIDPFKNDNASEELTAMPAPQPIRIPVGSEQTEEALALDRQAVRDIQARLLVLGHDPNGIDGKIGKGTRSAVRSWQSTMAVSPTGFLNDEQLVALKTASEPQLALWLQEPKNAKLYEPPPPIPLTPSRVSGRWNYVTNCGPRSKVGRAKIRGVLSVRHAGGNRYVGNLANSQGLRARFDGRLNGRTVSSTANFGFLFGKVNLRARVDDHQLVMRGRDSNGCSFYAAK